MKKAIKFGRSSNLEPSPVPRLALLRGGASLQNREALLVVEDTMVRPGLVLFLAALWPPGSAVAAQPQAVAVPLSVSATTQGQQQAPVQPLNSLVARRCPRLLPFLELHLLPDDDTTAPEFFRVGNSSSPLNVSITASSPSALALGVHYYLKYVALRHIAWGVSNLATIPIPPPRPREEEWHTVGSMWRYAWNVCTHGYTMAGWDWPRWELELDFMSLQGVNLPLLFAGQEFVQAKAFTKLGLNQSELAPFFSGPAFMPWQRMGNEAGWGGPLSRAYQEQAHELQVKILGRASALGMTVVLPCFGGNVPAAMRTHFPTANLKQFPLWNDFRTSPCCWIPPIRSSSPWDRSSLRHRRRSIPLREFGRRKSCGTAMCG